MKKIILCAVILSLMLLLNACGNDSSDVTGATDTPPASFNAGGYVVRMNSPLPLPDYPIIDGSSSTNIMHAAIRAYLTDAYFVDQHSQTYAALERLIPDSENPADVVLAVKYYDDILNDAKERGADLVITPIAKEGFVFLLHKDNPIDSLTQEQLRDIFSGKIKNWRELGGLDEEIIPVQRNWDSGSQTAIIDFMGDVPLTDMAEDDSVKLALSMGGMIETVWTSGSGAIGYNIYSWSLGQGRIFGMENLKLLSVDGIEPSIENLSDNSYPLMVYTYSYYNSGNSKGKALTDWLLTAEGQGVITSAGYVGIFGDYSLDEMPDFDKDERGCVMKIDEYYTEKELLDREATFHWAERVTDKEQTELLAVGKGKDVTVLYLVHFLEYATEHEYTQFIVLTREKDGVFEVINEGEALSTDGQAK
ncbi:MAG: substrate-binding domain-containing protein [Oscillospiraceae bacterium]|nr:substrate-binding domain-containing protein [Oscillospiraceae bacterium]